MISTPSPSDKNDEIGVECAFPYLSPVATTSIHRRPKPGSKVTSALAAAMLVLSRWGIVRRRGPGTKE